MNTIIDTIQPRPKKQVAYYEGVERNLFDFEDIRLTHRINSFNNKDCYQIEFYTDKTSDQYTVTLSSYKAQEEFKKIANILSSVNRNHNFLYNILTDEQHKQFEKFFNQFKNEELNGTYWICGSKDGDCGDYMLFWDEMLDNMEQSNTKEPNDDKKAFMELLGKVGDICEEQDIQRLFLSF